MKRRKPTPPKSGVRSASSAHALGVFEENLRLLQNRAPKLAAAIRNTSPPSIEISPHGDAGALVVDGIHLESAIDPAAEAEVQIANISEQASDVWCFGVGGGAAIARLLSRPDLRRLHLVPIAYHSFLALLTARPLPWLSDPRVDLTDRDAVPPQTLPSPRVAFPACLRLAEPHRLRDELLLDLASDHSAAHLRAIEQDRLGHAREHARRFPQARDVAELFGTRAGASFTIAAGGPTLSDAFEDLRQHRSATTLIAVTTALAPLEKADIVPDFVIAVDPLPWIAAHLEKLEHRERLREVPFIHAVDVHPNAIGLWPGPLYAAYITDPIMDGLRKERPLGTLYCSGTVVHSAADFAVRLGAHRVRLLGADFSFPGGATHAAGATYARATFGPKYTVLDGQGREIPTNIQFLGYLRDLERYIAARPHVRFSRGSTRGAAIVGTTVEENTTVEEKTS